MAEVARGGGRGKVVVDGVLNYLSPSSLSTGDPDQTAGCPRRWHYKYVAGKKEPTTAAMTAGTELHAQVEHYLKTGDKVLGPQAMGGAGFIPKPMPGLLVEHAIGDGELTAAGVPVIGYMDLVRQGSTYIDGHGERADDPEGTVELLDWKTSGDIGRAWGRVQGGPGLIRTIQMPSYGEWAARTLGAGFLRLSHVYFSTKGRPASKKATRLHTREEIGRRWEQIEGVARSLVQIARVKPEHSSQVEANTGSCHAYGGCPHASYCKKGGEASLASMFGAGAARSLLQRVDAQGGNMSLLSKVPGSTPVVGLVVPVAGSGAPAGITGSLDLKAEMARLAQEQSAAQAAMLPPGFEAACKAVESAGKGFPTLVGKAAQAKAAMIGHKLEGAGLAGSGMLAGLTLSDPAQLTQLAEELGALPVAAAPPPGVALAPVSAPAPAAGLLPPDAPESKPELAAKPLVETPTEPPAESAPETPGESAKRGRGRPRKADAPPISQRVESHTVTERAGALERTETRTVSTAVASHGLTLFVDAIPSCPYVHLDSYIDGLASLLATEYEAADIRCPPNGTPLDFGKWRGAMAALVRDRPPAAGTYVVFTRSEVDQVVADALRTVASLYVRGVR